jgi:hypothetical protein
VCGLILAGLSGTPLTNGFRYSVIVVLAIAMGIQNAAARTLAVPDLTTTVLTMTITGVAADSHVAGGQGAKAGRRLIAIAAMLVGAVRSPAPYLGRFFAAALDRAISSRYRASSTSKLSNPNPSQSGRAYRSLSAPVATSRASFLPSAASCS